MELYLNAITSKQTLRSMFIQMPRTPGVYAGKSWFQFQWPTDLPYYHISIKEMVPVVAASVVWGMSLQGLMVHFHSDNSVVVALLNSVRDEVPNAPNTLLGLSDSQI